MSQDSIPASSKTWPTILSGVALAIIYLVTYYPGLASVDSIDQLVQARNHVYSNWHPALMGYLWHYLDIAIPGQGGMLLLQVTLFTVGLSIICFELLGPKKAPFLVLMVGLCPSVFSIVGTVWKDVQMASAMFFSLGLFLVSLKMRPRYAWMAVGLSLVSLIYATAVRHNAASASLPMIVWAGYRWLSSRPNYSLPARWIAIIGTAILAVVIYPLTKK